MVIAALKEALSLLKRMPSLWIPGIAGGLLAAVLFLSLDFYGAFFAGRLILLSGLVLLIFTTGMLAIIRNNEGGVRALLAGGVRYYFRIVLPLFVIISVVILIFLILMVTFSFFGISDVSIVTALTVGFTIPTIILTFFFDTAAVFEDCRVFESIRRSIRLVFTHLNEVIVFLLISLAISLGIIFALIIIWDALLYDALEPLTRYNETQLQTFSLDQFSMMIGPTGVWITAGMLFFGIFLLIPILYSYKACFFRKLAGKATITQQPTTGEFDSKGRWYKY